MNKSNSAYVFPDHLMFVVSISIYEKAAIRDQFIILKTVKDAMIVRSSHYSEQVNSKQPLSNQFHEKNHRTDQDKSQASKNLMMSVLSLMKE